VRAESRAGRRPAQAEPRVRKSGGALPVEEPNELAEAEKTKQGQYDNHDEDDPEDRHWSSFLSPQGATRGLDWLIGARAIRG
jgi:hypothetical protein